MSTQVLFYRHAFLRHAPTRYAVMRPLADAQRAHLKYHETTGVLTDAMITQHLAGAITLAAPAAQDGQAHLLPLDIDAGGRRALMQLIHAAARQGLWAFGQFCPRPHWRPQAQRGYVWLAFAEAAPAAQLQMLGQQLIQAVQQPEWKIEARAHAAVTRLPLGRHTHTGLFGELLLPGQLIAIDRDPAQALAALEQAYTENATALLPALPHVPAARTPRTPRPQLGSGITIARFNALNDLVALLQAYGARHARGSRRLMHCCGHPDERRASLLLWRNRRGELCCKCLSEHHQCPLSGEMRDAFGVYCAMESLTASAALRRLNEGEAA